MKTKLKNKTADRISPEPTMVPPGRIADDSAMTLLAVTDIVASPTNPRKHFDAHKLQELADSIAVHGLIQPVLVRPMPMGVGTFAGKARQYELVAGERRWRASKAAGLVAIPAIVRTLDDRDVLEIQVIENLQRDDLHPLEEAAGYDQLIKAHGYRPEDLAAKVGKSKRYVYQRIQLLTLSPKVRKAFEEDLIPPSVADRLARIPNPAIQEAALDRVGPTKNHECLSVRETERVIEEEFMLRLKDAPFNVKVDYLVPVGGAFKPGCAMRTVGSCADCPKRTGNQAELFPDVQSADICTDPACYGQKVDAHWRQLKTAAETRGQRALEGREAESLRYDYKHAKLTDKCYEDEKNRSWGQVLKEKIKTGEVLPTLLKIGNEVIEIVPKVAALKAVGLGREEVTGDDSSKQEERKREALKKLRLAVAGAAVPGVIEALNPAIFHREQAVWQLLATTLFTQARADELGFVAKRRGLCDKVSEGNEAIKKWLKTALSCEELGGFVLELVVMAHHGISSWSFEFSAEFQRACKLAGVDLKALEAEKKAELKGAPTKKEKPAAPMPAAADVKEGKSKAFAWNENGVAEKPETLEINLGKKPKFSAAIKVASKDGRWFYGYEACKLGTATGDGGGGCLPSLSDHGFESRADAVTAARDEVVRKLESYGCPPGVRQAVEDAVDLWLEGGK